MKCNELVIENSIINTTTAYVMCFLLLESSMAHKFLPIIQ